MINKKGSEAVTGRTIALIIAVLVIILVVALVIKVDPNFLYKLLPDYKQQQDNGDEVIGNIDDLLASPCELESMTTVGKLVKAEDGSVGNIVFIKDSTSNFGSNEGVVYLKNLIYRKGSTDYNAMLEEDISGDWNPIDRTVAAMTPNGDNTQAVFLVGSEYTNENSEIYVRKLLGELEFSFTAEQMAILRGAIFKSGFICKKPDASGSLLTGYVSGWPVGTDVKIIDLSSADKKIFIEEVVGYPNILDLSPYVFWDAKKEEKTLKKPDQLVLSASDGNYFYIKIYRDGKISEPVGILTQDGSIWFNVATNTAQPKSLAYFEKNSFFGVVPWFGTHIESSGWSFSTDVMFHNYNLEDLVYSKTNIKVDYQEIKKQVG